MDGRLFEQQRNENSNERSEASSVKSGVPQGNWIIVDLETGQYEHSSFSVYYNSINTHIHTLEGRIFLTSALSRIERSQLPVLLSMSSLC